MTVQELQKKIEVLYKEDNYFLLSNTATSLLDKFGVSSYKLYKVFKILNLSRQKTYIDLVSKNNPKDITAFELIKKYNLKLVKVSTLKRYAKKIYGIPYMNFYDKQSKELEEEINEMLEEYEFPLLQLGRIGIINYLGIGINKYYTLKKQKRWSKRKEYKRLFKTYPLDEYSMQEIADITGKSKATIIDWVEKLKVERTTKKAISMKVIKARRERYGLTPVKDQIRKISYKKIKVWFENKLLSQKELSIKEIKEYLGRKDMNKVLYWIKKNYGLIDYVFDYKELKYKLKDNDDI